MNTFGKKCSWHMMALAMALAYVLLHHSLAQASHPVPERNSQTNTVPLKLAEPTAQAPHPQRHTLQQVTTRSLLAFPIMRSGQPAAHMVDCQPVSLNLDPLADGLDADQTGSLLVTTLCHWHL